MSVTSIDASQSADNGLPTKLFSSREIAEMVLQVVGAYTPMDAAADPDEIAITLNFMELVIGELPGRVRLQALVPATIEFELEDDTRSYVLSDVAGSSFPSRRIAFPISAWKRIGTDGGETPVDIIRRDAYEEIVSKETSGPVDKIYIDRSVDDPVLYTYPVKAADTTDVTLRIVCQTFAPSVFGATADQDQAGDNRHGLERTWQLWLVNATAYRVGNGPVRQCGRPKLEELKADAANSLVDLLAFGNRENQSMRLRRTRRYGG